MIIRQAGNTMIIDSHASMIEVPETKPSSCRPRKSVAMSMKNVPAAVTAPISMPEPLRRAVVSSASRSPRPRKSSSS